MIHRPIRATKHCRHYSYENGPCCACGHVFSPGDTVLMCLPLADGLPSPCGMREDYTEAERTEWQTYQIAILDRLSNALGALPAPIPENTSGEVACPNCNGIIRYARWSGGAALECATNENCVPQTRFNIARGAEWPAPQGDAE